MLIGEIVNRTGLTKDAIRFYEKKGLIAVNRGSSPYNNYKEYSKEILSRLLTIKGFKSAGFTIKEVAILLNLIDLDLASCSTVVQIVEEKISEIEKKINELKTIKQSLRDELTRSRSYCIESSSDKNCLAISRLGIEVN